MNIDFNYMIDIHQLSCGFCLAKGRVVEWEGGGDRRVCENSSNKN
jgi:hypothetical protein